MDSALANFAILILTNARPDRVKTYDTLRVNGYSGRIYIVIDNLDIKREEYEKGFGEQVVIFDKDDYAAKTDSGDNTGSLRGVVYARNAAHDIARTLGLEFFLVLDDDYTSFQYRFDETFSYNPKALKNLEPIFAAVVRFLEISGANTVALAQGGDYIGGDESPWAQKLALRRKCMNSFFCKTDRPFSFLGRINEDTTLYVDGGVRGDLYFTINQVNLNQIQTQSNAGGLTEIYLDSGTYVKSFYTVMWQPSACRVRMLDTKNSRLHHSVSWKNATPMILSENYRKATL